MSKCIQFFPIIDKCTVHSLLELKRALSEINVEYESKCTNVFDGRFSKLNNTLLDDVCVFLGLDEIITAKLSPINTLSIWCDSCTDEQTIMLKLLFDENFKVVVH